MRTGKTFSLINQTRIKRALLQSPPPPPPQQQQQFVKPLLTLNTHFHKPYLNPFNTHNYHYSTSTLVHHHHHHLPSNLRFFNASSSYEDDKYETDDNIVIEEWEEEDDTEPEIGDGGAGGGIVLQNVPWGERVLSLAREVLIQFGDDFKLYSFKTTPRGYIYIRLDKLSNEYGCPSMEEIESYSQQYKKRLDEEGSKGQIPDDLALEVSSPGAERLIRVPEDLLRFKEFPMVVTYVERESEVKSQEKNRFFYLDLIDMECETCVWKLADVRENRDPASKGRPLSRKQKDWRLKLPFSMLKKVTLYLDC